MKEPMKTAEKTDQGFIPITLPTTDPKNPPEPWNGTITNKTIPTN